MLLWALYLFIYFWLCSVSIAARALLCGELGLPSRLGVRASRCSGFPCWGPRALGRAGFRSCGSRALEHRLNNSCGAQTRLLHSTRDPPGSGMEPCLLHWQADSLPLSHQGSPLKNQQQHTSHVLLHP